MPPIFGGINFSIAAIPAYYAVVIICHVSKVLIYQLLLIC